MAKRVHRPRPKGNGQRPKPQAPGAPKPTRRVAHGSARPAKPAQPVATPRLVSATPERLSAVRELFWQNVIREILASLVVLSFRLTAKGGAPTDGPAGEDALDGRLGIITVQGQRIPIARVFPVFSASVGRTPAQVTLSTILESTVFQVHTPGGEVYTLPVQDIRGFHALTETLMEQLEQNSRGGDEGQEQPFGFAAFTSLARNRPLPDDDEADKPGMAGAD
ncbi:MAG: hypothetical protein U0637_03185 [Phycisphaerales bacterium]